MSHRALILGVGGQDGSYLADILLERGYEVHGLYRHSSVDNLTRIAHCRDRIRLHRGDVLDMSSLLEALQNIEKDSGGRVDEVYHVADQDNVGWSKEAVNYQIDVGVKGVINLLNAVLYNFKKSEEEPKVFIPSSSTIYGNALLQQAGDWPLDPQTPYAIAKAAVLHLCRYYRKEYGLKVYCGIMYGHDSPRRGPDYLLQKIARGEEIGGDLEKQVDIGYAKEFMESVVDWVQKEESGDTVFRSGVLWKIKSLLDMPKNIIFTDKPGEFSSHKGIHKDAARVLKLLQTRASRS